MFLFWWQVLVIVFGLLIDIPPCSDESEDSDDFFDSFESNELLCLHCLLSS